MRRYVCARTSGATCFFTVNLAQRRGSDLLVERIADLREAFRETRRDYPFDIDAIVILPEHLHAIWRFPQDDADFSTRWSLIRHGSREPSRLANVSAPVGRAAGNVESGKRVREKGSGSITGER